MKELTRIMTVEITMIGNADGAVDKDDQAKAIAGRIKEAVGADDVKVAKVQDFVMEDKEDGETGEQGIEDLSHGQSYGRSYGRSESKSRMYQN